jgi:hypothetical protein
VTEPTTVGSASNHDLLRQRREKRVDHVHEIPYHQRTTVECPDCGISIETGIYGLEIGPSYSSCWNCECDAFHKFRRDRDQEADDDQDDLEDDQPIQTGLQYFGGDA